ncbi:MAG: hypothetical protein GY841_16490, partial [FCB group bacterium]|nr:hypothetical protein [FCB group bacterium]
SLVEGYAAQSDAAAETIANLKVEIAQYPDSDKFRELLVKTEVQKAKIDALVIKYQADLDKIDGAAPGADLSALGAGLTTAAPMLPPPWGLILGAAGTVIGGIGAASAKKQKTNAEKSRRETKDAWAGYEVENCAKHQAQNNAALSDAKYEAHKDAVNEFVLGLDDEAKRKLYKLIGDKRKDHRVS